MKRKSRKRVTGRIGSATQPAYTPPTKQLIPEPKADDSMAYGANWKALRAPGEWSINTGEKARTACEKAVASSAVAWVAANRKLQENAGPHSQALFAAVDALAVVRESKLWTCTFDVKLATAPSTTTNAAGAAPADGERA